MRLRAGVNVLTEFCWAVAMGTGTGTGTESESESVPCLQQPYRSTAALAYWA
ncbi:MAG: hypothetical protein WBA57_15335 [Elainellaceae cyanobacterium]